MAVGSGNRKSGKRPMRIAMIGHKLIPSRNGGVEVVVSNLAPRLVTLGDVVTCYNRTSEDSKKDGLPREYRGVKLIWTPTIKRRGLAAMSSSTARPSYLRNLPPSETSPSVPVRRVPHKFAQPGICRP